MGCTFLSPWKEGRRYYICEAFTIYKNIQQPKNTLIIIIIIISLSVLPSMFRRLVLFFHPSMNSDNNDHGSSCGSNSGNFCNISKHGSVFWRLWKNSFWCAGSYLVLLGIAFFIIIGFWLSASAPVFAHPLVIILIADPLPSPQP